MMNLKKIIKEEINLDLDWIKDSKPSLYNKVIIFEPMIDEDEWEVVSRDLVAHNQVFGENIKWSSNKEIKDSSPLEDNVIFLHHLVILNDGRTFHGSLDTETFSEMIDHGYTEDEIRKSDYEYFHDDILRFIGDFKSQLDEPEYINGRDYFNIPYKRTVNESQELDWLNFDYNPWIEHDAIIFDKIPEKEDLKKYLEMALYTKNPDNYSDWDDLDHSVKFILDNIRKNMYLRFDEWDELLFGGGPETGMNFIKYSTLINTKNINESQDEWDWLKDAEDKPKIIPGGIIDTENSSFTKKEILEELNRLGYVWGNTDHPILDKFGNLEITPFQYVLIGEIKNNIIQLGVNKILHEDNLEWMEEYGFDKLIYTT